MSEATGTEFWRDLKPIDKPYSSPTRCPRSTSPTRPPTTSATTSRSPTRSGSRPLWISPTQNRWCDILCAKGRRAWSTATTTRSRSSRYTLSGKWGYLEHDWVATKGDFVYETPGEAHTLVAYEHDEPMKVFFNVTGPLIWLDENGESAGTFDVHDYIALARDHYEKVGLGAPSDRRAHPLTRDARPRLVLVGYITGTTGFDVDDSVG